jgi:hypothetical protein
MYTEEIADEIIERMCWGHTLVSICRQDVNGNDRIAGTFPSVRTVYDWGDGQDGPRSSRAAPDFPARFARAKLTQQRVWLEETVDIANTPDVGVEEVREHSEKNGLSLRRAYKDMTAHRAMKIRTRLEVIARMNPQLWAERLQQAAPQEQDPSAAAPRLIVEGGLPDDATIPPAPDPADDDPRP